MEKYNKYHESLYIDCECNDEKTKKVNKCSCGGMKLPSHDNQIDILIKQLKREVEKLMKTTEAKLLCQSKKIDETMVYIKNNLSNSIRNLLNSMINSGELDEIITDTINSTIDLIEEENKEIKNRLNSEITERINADNDLESQIQALASGSPLVANSISEMTNTSKVYVNTTNGYWYYYNGSSWVQGGIYQSTGIADNSVGLNQTKFASENIVGVDKYEVGSTSQQGNNIDSNISLRTKGYILFNKGDVIKLNNTTDWKIYVNLYSLNGYQYINRIDWTNTPVTIPYDCYVRYVVRKNDNTELTIDMALNLVSLFTYNPSKYPIIFSPLRSTTITNYKVIGNDINISLSSGRYYLILSNGAKVPITLDDNTSFLIPNYYSLVYDPKNNLIKVISHDDPIDYDEIVLLLHNERGKATNGILVPYILNNLIESVSSHQFNYLYGKKIVAIGDSMVEGDSLPRNDVWLSLIGNRNNMEYINYGYNGCTLTYVDTGNYTKENSVYGRYQSMDNDADYVLVFAGTNDIQREVTLGTEDSTDLNTFYGSLNALCEGLLNKYPNKKIAFITPYARSGIEDRCKIYVEAIKKACLNHGGIPVFDNIINGGIDFNNDIQSEALLMDTYHLNSDGMKFVSYKYEQFLRQL